MRERVTVRCAHDHRVTVDAEIYGLWAVTPEIDPRSGGPTRRRGRWRVTHVPSGYSATQGRAVPKSIARRIAQTFARQFNGDVWDRAVTDIPAQDRDAALAVLRDILPVADEGDRK